MDVRLPQLAEGADTGTVVSVLVQEGQTVQKGQTVLELENQKAVAPISAPVAGTVTKIYVKQGEVVGVGQVLISLAEEGASAAGAAVPHARGEPVEPRAPSTLRQAQGEQSQSVPSVVPGLPPAASPSIRRMARELGIDLTQVRGSDRGGRITAADLRAFLERSATEGQQTLKPQVPRVDFGKWGPITRKPFTALRKTIAAVMVESWTTIPHVTQFDEADPSALLNAIEKQGPAYEDKGVRLTLTALLLRVLVPVLKQYPIFNSSLDEASQELVLKDYFHIGIAVDTEAGLIVPVLHDVDQKSLFQISQELADLAEKSRQRKLTAEQLQGGSFTLSNQGGLGGGSFTPLVHKPEVAILGVGRAKSKRLPLALSYDHRVIDGADAARFITALVKQIENFSEKEVLGE